MPKPAGHHKLRCAPYATMAGPDYENTYVRTAFTPVFARIR